MLSDRTLCGHKLVLVARSRHWNNKDDNLSSTAQLDLSNMTPFVAVSLVRWVYTDVIVLPSDQDAIIELLAASNRYQLKPLKEKLVENCMFTYQTRLHTINIHSITLLSACANMERAKYYLINHYRVMYIHPIEDVTEDYFKIGCDQRM